jgi:hypothetical protein
LGLLSLSITLLSGCAGKPDTRGPAEEPKEEIQEKKDHAFTLVNSKIEPAGPNTNKMDLYIPKGELDVSDLKELSNEKISEFTEGAFYFLVVFDKKENAVFPTTPFTAHYGMDEEPQRHIIAYLEYNRLNGYKTLTTYSTNSWDGKPTAIPLE